MRYYVLTDPHGFCSLVREELEVCGYFHDPEPHKLIICGDLLDRGFETIAMQDFAIERMNAGELIFIRGNHEDLMERLLEDLLYGDTWDLQTGDSYHVHNGTWQSALRLADMTEGRALARPAELVARVKQTPFYRYLLPAALDYYETEHYIFTHGWIPCRSTSGTSKYAPYKSFYFNPDWREAPYEDWVNARWYNGMEFACRRKMTVQDKTVVCGHVRTSYGHAYIEGKGDDELHADYSPFYAPGIIALDGCIVRSGQVNCLLIED